LLTGRRDFRPHAQRGGTAEIVRWNGDALRDAGIRVEVRRARQVKRVDGYDAAEQHRVHQAHHGQSGAHHT
jgi:hypothetical protein